MQLSNASAIGFIAGVFVANEVIRRAFPEKFTQLNVTVSLVAMPILLGAGLMYLGRNLVNAFANPQAVRQFPEVWGRLTEMCSYSL